MQSLPDGTTIFDYAIFNGELLPAQQAQISIFNKAVFSSFGVYEAVKVEQGQPFYLKEHLRRLFNSAKMLELELNTDINTMVGWFDRLNQIAPQSTCRLMIIALGTVENGTQPLVAMKAEVLPAYPAKFYQEGATATLYEGQRSLPPCKSLNTLVNYLARRAATQAGALEGLLYHNSCLTEGSRSNLFAVCQNQLFTPPQSQVLSGITRDIILQVMQSTSYPVIEAPLSVDLSIYQEFFITSTSMHVMPIIRVDGQTIGSGRVGPVTKLAMAQFETHYRQVMNLR